MNRSYFTVVTIFIIQLLSSFTVFNLFGQITFEKTFGGPKNDFGNSIQQTLDGGYILFGLTESYGQGGWDMYLIKTDSLGNTEWEKTYGSVAYEVAGSVEQTTDGGFILSGAFGGLGNDSLTLIKTDASGNEIWNNRYRGSIFRNVGRFVQQTNDEGFIVTGYSGGSFVEDVFLLKTNANGDKQWEKTFGGNGREEGVCVQQLADDGYAVLGETNSRGHGNTDMYLLRLDRDGDTLWTKTYGTDLPETGRSFDVTPDGGFILFGDEETSDGDMYLVRTDSNGDELWHKYYGDDNRESGYAIEMTSDEGFILAGSRSNGNSQPTDMYCLKTDNEGSMEWEASFREGYLNDATSVCQTTDGGYALLGSATYDTLNGFTSDMYLVKIDPFGKILSSSLSLKEMIPNVFPNPATEYAIVEVGDLISSKFTLLLYSIDGKWIRNMDSQDSHSFRVDRGDLLSGIYFFKLLYDDHVRGRGKIIFQ